MTNAYKYRHTASFLKVWGGGLIQKRPYFKLPKILKILIRGRGGGLAYYTNNFNFIPCTPLDAKCMK